MVRGQAGDGDRAAERSELSDQAVAAGLVDVVATTKPMPRSCQIQLPFVWVVCQRRLLVALAKR